MLSLYQGAYILYTEFCKTRSKLSSGQPLPSGPKPHVRSRWRAENLACPGAYPTNQVGPIWPWDINRASLQYSVLYTVQGSNSIYVFNVVFEIQKYNHW